MRPTLREKRSIGLEWEETEWQALIQLESEPVQILFLIYFLEVAPEDLSTYRYQSQRVDGHGEYSVPDLELLI